jgi:hypothetical protein
MSREVTTITRNRELTQTSHSVNASNLNLTMDMHELIISDKDQACEIRPINGVAEMKSVYELTHESYVAENYSEHQPNGLLLHYPEFDVIPETTVLIARQNNKIIGTLSLTIPGPFGFTIDRDFKKEIALLQQEGRVVVVMWRLAVKKEYRSSRSIVIGLFTEAARVALNAGANSLLIEVNPKHERVYKRMLNMTTVSRVDGAEGLQHAPGILLRGDLENFPKEWILGSQALQSHEPIGLEMLEQILEPNPEIRKAS